MWVVDADVYTGNTIIRFLTCNRGLLHVFALISPWSSGGEGRQGHMRLSGAVSTLVRRDDQR
jgi:hypothetical protein